MIKPPHVPDLPYPRFSSTQPVERWLPVVRALATLSLPIRDIAATLRVSPALVRANEALMEEVRLGHAAHRLAVESALLNDALLDPLSFSDPAERGAARAARTAAIRLLKQSIDKKEEWTPPQETERLRRLSDAELEAELQRFRASTTG